MRGLSSTIKSVPAFQALTIGAFSEANLDVSLQSLLRHVKWTPPEYWQDSEKAKKRKNDVSLVTSNGIQRPITSVAPRLEYDLEAKKLKHHNQISGETDTSSKHLSRSIEALYESISRAQTELETGRLWNSDAH